MYNAVVARLENVREHPNADRLQLADANGYLLVVGINAKDGDVGFVFPCDGQLSELFCEKNDLVRRKLENGQPAGGMFDPNRRVRAQSLRGVKSEAFFIELQSAEYTLYDLSTLKPGDLVSDLNGHVLATKYISPATLRAQKGGTPATKRKNLSFHEHYDTTQLRHYLWPEDAIVYVTYKLHGTSGRTGYVIDEEDVKRTWLDKLLRRNRVNRDYKVLNGTRRTIMRDGKPGYYEDESFREKAVDHFIPGLKKGEVIYYELVGYTSDGGLIMGEHDVRKTKDKELIKQYGEKVAYTYGTLPGETALYVYHIKHVNEDGDSIDLPWHHVKARCRELGLKHVPEITPYPMSTVKESMHLGWDKQVENIVELYADGPDPICPAHPTEGIVFRVEHNGKVEFVKQKGWSFMVMEDIIKADDNYVDMEESN